MLSLDLLDRRGISPERLCVTPSLNLMYAVAGSDAWESAARFIGQGWRSTEGRLEAPAIRCDEPLLALFGEREIDRSPPGWGYTFFSFEQASGLYLHRPLGRENVALSKGQRWETVYNPWDDEPAWSHRAGEPLLLYPLSLVEHLTASGFSFAVGQRARLSDLAV